MSLRKLQPQLSHLGIHLLAGQAHALPSLCHHAHPNRGWDEEECVAEEQGKRQKMHWNKGSRGKGGKKQQDKTSHHQPVHCAVPRRGQSLPPSAVPEEGSSFSSSLVLAVWRTQMKEVTAERSFIPFRENTFLLCLCKGKEFVLDYGWSELWMHSETAWQ